MVYQYKVTLKGIKGFYRIYNINSTDTLYAFHKQMRTDMEFPQDQNILFKAFSGEDVVARFAFIDLGNGCVDKVTMADTVKKGITSFTYFYDTTNKKSVEVSFLGEAPAGTAVTGPVICESKGPDPIEFENGYVAFEDLPDEQRHLPSESDKAKKGSKLEDLLNAIAGSDDEESADDEDIADDSADAEDIEEEEDDEEQDPTDEDGMEVFDGSEELTL